MPELGSYLGVPLVISAAAVAVVDDQGEEQLFPSMSAARAFVRYMRRERFLPYTRAAA